VNANATDVAAVAEDALVVLVMVWRWIIVPLGWLLVLVLTPWVLARSGTPASPAGMAPTERSAGMRPVARPDRRTVYWASALAAFLAIAVYVDSLGNGLVLDDESVIVENQAVRHPLDWRTILLTSSWFSDVAPSIAYRPLTTWTFALDHALHAERPFGYHLVNVLGHAAVTALVVALAASLGLSPPAAGLAGALFAVHPIHTEVVANGVGRAEILAAGLALVALLAWRRAATGRQSLLGAAAIATAYALALLAKEHAIALIVLLPLADLLFIDGGSPSLYLRRLRGRRALLYLALATLTIGYLALRAVALGGVVGAGGSGVSRWPFWLNPTASAPAGLRIATALKVQALALWLLLVPFHLSADYYYDQIPVVASLSEPGAIAGLLVAMLLAALAVVLWRRRLAFFWLMLALLTYGVVSNIPFPIGTIFGERLLYLPSVGFCALVAMILTRPTGGWPRTFATVVGAVLVVGWGVRTGLRNPVWHDNLSLAEATVVSAPNSALAHHFLGTTYSQLGRDAEAIEELNRAISIYPAYVDALFNAGVIYMSHQQHREALILFSRVTDIQPQHFASWIDSAAIHNGEGDFTAALDAAERATAIRPEAPNGHVMKGFALLGLRRLAEARASFQKALRLPHAQPDALLGLGTVALEQGDFRECAVAFETLVKLAPIPDAYRSLVRCYRGAGREADAARVAAAGRARFPNDPSLAP